MRITFFIVPFSFLLLSCQEWEYPQNFPIVSTEEVTNITLEEIVFIGSVESLGSNQQVIRYGFVLGDKAQPTLDSSFPLIVTGKIKKGKFSHTIKGGTREGYTYYVRTFVETDNLVIYGNGEKFVSLGSLPPSIIDFTPTAGKVGSLVEIRGEKFSFFPNGNAVNIVGRHCTVISESDTLIKVQVPVGALPGHHANILIVVGDHYVLSKDEFTILP